MVSVLLRAALEDVVVEVGAVAAGDAQDVEGADLLHSCSFPRCISSLLSVSISYIVVPLWSPWSLQRRLLIFVMSPSITSLNSSVSHRQG